MRTAFADTYHFLASLDTREAAHRAALAASREAKLRLVTTEWVLAEFGDAYHHPGDRHFEQAGFVALFK